MSESIKKSTDWDKILGQEEDTGQDERCSELADMACSASVFYPLFEHMAQTHGLTLTESEMSDIAAICEKIDAVDAELPETLRDTEAVVKEIFRRMDNL